MKGVKSEWANLPKRKCDNCGTPYKPVRPLWEGERGFCQANCRKEYHKHGGAFGPLRRALDKAIAKRIKELSPADGPRIEAIERRLERLESAMRGIQTSTLSFRQ